MREIKLPPVDRLLLYQRALSVIYIDQS